MTQNNRVYTVAEAAALPDGSWVDGTLRAHVIKVETVPKKAGGNFWKAFLSDGGAEPIATISLFFPPKFSGGDGISLSGPGIKRESYQGKAQIKTGKDTKIDVSVGSKRVETALHEQAAEQANGAMLNGAQVGGAMAHVFDALTRSLNHEAVAEKLTAPGFWHLVYDAASDYVRICQMIERGKLAPPVRERTNGHATQRQAPTPQPVSRTVTEADFDPGEDPPF